jgi:plasmanylethanolamine desaturase
MLEVCGILAFVSLEVHLGWRIVRVAEGPWEFAALGACMALGFLLADFLSGLVHWAGDTVGTEQMPWVGRHFIKPFRMHHVDPKDITRHDFIETNGNNCLASLPFLLVTWLVLPAQPGFRYYACALVVMAALFVFLTNQFHKWAHADRPPRVVQRLQRWNFILPPEHHDIHHRAPHDTYYCITVGWLNPLLARLRFFRGLEAVIALMRPGLLQLAERGQTASAGAAQAPSAATAPVAPAAIAPSPRVTPLVPPGRAD